MPRADKQHPGPRLQLQIAGLQGRGIEAGKLSRLLADLSSTLSAMVPPQPGKGSVERSGRPASGAGPIVIRVVLIGPDNAFIEVETVDPRARHVLSDFAAEMQRARAGEPGAAERAEIRAHVHAVLRDAAEIGPELHVRIHTGASSVAEQASRSDKPPKSAQELAAEQGLLGKPPPDYGRLATAVWETAEQLADAEEQLREIRR